MLNKVFVLGSINTDLVFEIGSMPQRGETLFGKSFFISAGGKGANQAVACALQDVHTLMLGSVGDDALSLDNIKSLKVHHVDVNHVDVIENQTGGVAGIFIEQGDNRIILDSGANAIHDVKKISKIIDAHGKFGDVLLAQLEIPVDIVEAMFIKAKAQGMTTVLNAAPAQKLDIAFMKYVDLLIVNEIEAEMLSGIALTNQEKIDQSLTCFLEQGVKEVIITLGEKGSYYKSLTQSMHQGSHLVHVIDTTAAGDTFIGVYLANRVKGADVASAITKATAASAIAIGKKGAQLSMPTAKQIEQFLKGELR